MSTLNVQYYVYESTFETVDPHQTIFSRVSKLTEAARCHRQNVKKKFTLTLVPKSNWVAILKRSFLCNLVFFPSSSTVKLCQVLCIV